MGLGLGIAGNTHVYHRDGNPAYDWSGLFARGFYLRQPGTNAPRPNWHFPVFAGAGDSVWHLLPCLDPQDGGTFPPGSSIYRLALNWRYPVVFYGYKNLGTAQNPD